MSAWATTPLVDSLDSFINTLPIDKHSDLRRPSRWRKLLLVCLDQELRPRFLQCLSEAQINSLRALLIWKSGLFAGPAVSIFDDKSPVKDDTVSSEDALCALRSQIRDMPDAELYEDSRIGYENGEEDRDSIITDKSPEPNAFDGLLGGLRSVEFKPGVLDQYENNVIALHQIRDDGATSISYRRLLTAYMVSRGITPFENKNPHQGYLALEKAIQDEVGFGSLGWSVQSCPWLSSEARTGLPWYLWDSVEQCTVETNDMLKDQKPQYVVVSHTWGRWRIKGANADMRPDVPWLVPENTKFDVRGLPEGLQLLCERLSFRYVWFDLLCIPQDNSERARIEIARQAAIFGGASIAIVWQNETENWADTQASLRWMALHQLRKPHRLPQYNPGQLHSVDQLIDEEIAAVTKQLSAVQIPDFNENLRLEQPAVLLEAINSNWFTSLWTLQEAFLRSDMLFMNRYWEVLTIDDHLPVALEGLLYLTTSCINLISPPKPVEWLVNLLMSSNMIILRNLHPLSLLAIGCARYCEHSRTEAIMSVLGATDWFKEVIERGPSMSNVESLILGRYEYGFVKEVMAREGFVFFSSQYGTHNEFRYAKEEQRPVGTILPFSKRKDWALFDLKFLNKWSDYVIQMPHASIQTWMLLKDGTVRIQEAGIIYATPAGYSSGSQEPESEDRGTILPSRSFGSMADLEVEFTGPEVGGPIDLFEFTTTLESWMDATMTDTPKYAVYISAGHFLQGFVLKEISIAMGSSSQIAAKIADFMLPLRGEDGTLINVGCPPTTLVDWVVY